MRISDWSSDVCSSDLHADSSIAVAPGLGPTEFTYFARLCDHADSHTTVAPGLGPGAHCHQRVARSCKACVLAGRERQAAARPTNEWSGVLGPGNKSRDDSLCVPRAGLSCMRCVNAVGTSPGTTAVLHSVASCPGRWVNPVPSKWEPIRPYSRRDQLNSPPTTCGRDGRSVV